MNMLYVAYNGYGDLIASDYSYSRLLDAVERMGYATDEVLIGKVTP